MEAGVMSDNLQSGVSHSHPIFNWIDPSEPDYVGEVDYDDYNDRDDDER